MRISSDRYGPGLHIDTQTGEQFLYYGFTDRELRSDLALIVGDAVHNLKSALDIAYRETIKTVSPAGFNPTKTKFIVGNNRKHLESQLEKTAKVAPSSKLFRFLVDVVKSHEGGDVDICALHALDVSDKHHLLIPMITVVAIDGVELENEDGTIDRYLIALTKPNFYRKVVPFGCKFKNHGEVRFDITFRKGSSLEGEKVILTLKRFSAKVEEIVDFLRRLAKSG